MYRGVLTAGPIQHGASKPRQGSHDVPRLVQAPPLLLRCVRPLVASRYECDRSMVIEVQPTDPPDRPVPGTWGLRPGEGAAVGRPEGHDPRALAPVIAITKCRIWMLAVNRFTPRRDVLRQGGHISDGWSVLVGWRGP